MGGEGLETEAHSTAKTAKSQNSAANALHPKPAGGSACRNDSDAEPMPADLAQVVKAWPNLSAEKRAAILAAIA